MDKAQPSINPRRMAALGSNMLKAILDSKKKVAHPPQAKEDQIFLSFQAPKGKIFAHRNFAAAKIILS